MLLKQQKTKHTLTLEAYFFLCFTCKGAKKIEGKLQTFTCRLIVAQSLW